MLRNYGIVIEDDDKYEDTYLMAAIWDASLKPQERGLKFLVEKFIGREMIEINELGIEGSKKNTVAFDMVPPQKAVYYGASDGMCTFALYEFLKAKIDEQDPTGKKGPWAIYGIEKRCMFVTMEMERSLAKIDRAYFEKCKEDVIDRMNKLVTGIYNIAGREFDVNSPKQLGTLLFEELKIPYPIKEKTKTGLYITSEKILELLEGKYPIIDMILTYRGYGKVMGTYIENFLKNADENEEVKFSLNQIGADTGRYSASGGQGLNEDGYSGVNCENIPNYDPDNPNSVNLRKGVIARPGYKMVSIDYSGEELRIAANYSREPKWIDEFLNGTGDLHTKTAQAVTGKQKVSKMERRNSKTLNFHILYGGGAGGFAARAKLPYHVAKKMLIDFFREYSSLKRWIDKEAKAAKLRGYSLTALGRRRPLGEFYNNPDPKIAAKGDRCAINSAVQGAAADLIKIALYRVWKWIRDSGLQNDIRILAPIHDEILFEVKEDKLDALVPEMCNIMRLPDITKALKWPVPLDVDVEYGDSFYVDHNFWEEQKEKQKATSAESPKPDNKETPGDRPPVAPSIEITPQPEPGPVEEIKPTIIEEVQEKKNDNVSVISVVMPDKVPNTVTASDMMPYFYNVTVKKSVTEGVEKKKDIQDILNQTGVSKDSKPAFQDAHIKDRIDERGYFNYPLEIDSISARKLKFIFDTLVAAGDNVFIGPKYKVCLLSKEGEVYFRSSEVVAIDAFVALCLAFNI